MSDVSSHQLTDGFCWSISLSILMIVLGLAALFLPLVASFATALTVGWMLILIGLLHFAFSWHAQSRAGLFGELFLSLLYLATGSFAIRHAFAGAVSLGMILGIYLGLKGVLELIAGLFIPLVPGRIWQLLDGIVSLFLACIIWIHFPQNAAFLLGVFVGISILLGGFSRLQFFLAARRLWSR